MMNSWMLKVDCDPNGGMTLDETFYVDFGTARGHEIHLPGATARPRLLSNPSTASIE
ncbi:MAG: hypothetical protein WKH64_19260 [Chloroflexia bacterium]